MATGRAFIFMLEDLAIQQINKIVDRDIQIAVICFCKNGLATHVHRGFGLLLQFVHGEDYADVYQVVKVTLYFPSLLDTCSRMAGVISK